MVIAIAGYFVLMVLTFLLFALSGYETLQNSAAVALVIVHAAVIIALAYEARREWLLSIVREKLNIVTYGREDAANFISVVSGTLVTYFLSVNLGMGPVVAAGLVGLFATLALPRFDVPIYCGAFAGMACPILLHTYFHVSLAGLVAGMVFVLTKSVFNGFGGKLGTIAFTGCIVAALVTGKQLSSAPVPDWSAGRLLIMYSIAGALLTFIFNARLNHSPVISSAIVGLAGGLVLPVIHPGIGEMLGVMVICATFAGMSSRERIPNELYMCAAGFFCAMVFMYGSPHLGGAGGKLGTIAFGSVIAVRGMIDTAHVIKERSPERVVRGNLPEKDRS